MRDKSYCWKCEDYIGYRTGKFGLCQDCTGNLSGIVIFFNIVGLLIAAYLITTHNHSLTNTAAAFVALIVSEIALVAVSLVLYNLGKWLWGWIKPATKQAFYLYRDWQAQRHVAMMQRSNELTEANKLTGMELDAALTRQYQETMGRKE
jgi:hypothetical protein